MKNQIPGLTRYAPELELGRFTMLEHHHSWSFDPSHKITVSTGDAIFREIRYLKPYTCDHDQQAQPLKIQFILEALDFYVLKVVLKLLHYFIKDL